MFSKKVHVDVKKSTLKIQDSKKDSATRLKHLKIVIDNVETEEAKNFFESNFSHIYYVLYESFVVAETNLRQRVHKAHREELECVLGVLEKVLILLPELLARRWQCHSIGRIMSKLLHPANSWKLRRDAIRLFLLWYQALGEFAPDVLHAIFATLVPGFPSPLPGEGLPALMKNSAATGTSGTVFHDTHHGPVMPVEILPLLPPQSGDKQPDEPTRFFLDILLENMVSQVTRLEWRDRFPKQQKCFTFLFERFKQYYLPHIFPQFSYSTNLYKPILDFPEVRKPTPTLVEMPDGKRKQDPFIICRVTVIKWVSSFTQLTRRGDTPFHTHPSLTPSEDDSGMELRRVSVSQAGAAPHDTPSSLLPHDSTSQPPSLLSQVSQGSQQDASLYYVSEDPSMAAMLLVRDVLYGTKENVNFIHEVYRQAFLLNFTHSPAIRRAIGVYKDWIQMNVPEIPPFLLEPESYNRDDQHLHSSSYSRSGPPSSEYPSLDGSDISETGRPSKLRSDSYLGAIQRDGVAVRAGMQNVLQMFITNAANVFLLEVSVEYPLLLEEQVDTCKRVLNIYRYMVMHTRMEPRTWEQLLLILLRITSLILSKTPPRKKEDTLGGKLAPAIFQTLIVTWIKANLNVVIGIELWDRFLQVLSSLTQWEELIREWSKTLETLTRVLARHVYGLDLNDLPLDRLTEQKVKKRRGGKPGPGLEHRPSLGNVLSDTSSSTLRGSSSVQPPPQPAAPTLMHEGSDTSCPSPESSGNFRHTRKRHGSSGENSRLSSPHLPHGRPALQRTSSESALVAARKHRQGHHKSSTRHTPAGPGNTVIIPVLPASVEKEVDRLLASPQNFSSQSLQMRPLRKSHSLDSLRTNRAGTPFQYSESEGPTRTPSPAPSSGMESNSIKDSPMQIDMISSDGNSIELNDSCERRSVMAGGSVKGWLPDVAVVLWRRMLCALGDVNRLPDPSLHAQVFEYLVELCHTLLKLRQNQGVSIDNLNTPPPPDLIPPTSIIAPWCFKAIALPVDYHRGQLYAHQLLCNITLAPQDLPPPKDQVVEFYRALHQGLTGTDQSIINILVRHCGSRFFSLMLPGFSLLIFDFIQAANTIVCSSDLRGVPRTEATAILGALLSLSNTLPNVTVLNPVPNQYTVISPSDTKEQVLAVLLRSGRREPAGKARCLALCSLGIFLYETLSRGATHPKLRDAINVLLLALRFNMVMLGQQSHSATSGFVKDTSSDRDEFNHKTVAQVACEAVLLLVDYSPRLLELCPDIPPRVVEVLALTLQHLLVVEDSPLNESDRRLLTSLLFCLGEWCMRLPPQCFLAPRDGACLLLTVFQALDNFIHQLCLLQSNVNNVLWSAVQVLNMVAVGGRSSPTEPLPPPDSDFDPNIRMDDLREGPWQGRRASSIPSNDGHTNLHNSLQPVRLAAKMVMMHLVNHLGHFPMAIGAARLSSLVVEHDDVPGLGADQLSAEVFSAPNIQLFVMSSRLLVSLVELPALESPGGGVTAGLCTAPSQARVILRDLGGKACWDASILYCSPEDQPPSTQQHTQPEHGWVRSLPSRQQASEEQMLMTSSFVGAALGNSASPPQHALRHRPPDVLPTWENAADDMDNLDDLLQYIGHTSPECLPGLDTARNMPAPPPLSLLPQAEEEAISTVLGQRLAERDYLQRHVADTHMVAPECVPVPPRLPESPFQHCRLLFSQLGMAGWERRTQLHLLRKNDHLLRELRNLDSQRCRETHKIAVMYVAEGQEDKNSILSNTCGSQAYEEFIAGLAWEVELESHTGFLGGLQRNKSTGDTAPYYATSFLEAIFHVATRMPSSSQESLLQKTRHLGNDEVHIVWSEHSRDYRRGIIPTEFCDALIVIYPLPHRLYRVQVSRKSEVPFFGPLFDESIVEHRVLPGLVRATAIAASRAKRSMLPFYQNYYEERAKALETIVRSHKDTTTFEEFASQVYSPVQTSLPFYHPASRVSSSGHTSRSPEPSSGTPAIGVGGPVMRSNSTSSATSQPTAPSSHSGSSSALAAALIDTHHPSSAVSGSASPRQSEHRFRGPDGIRVWFSGTETSSTSGSPGSSSSEPSAHGISPRPTKKLSFKTGPKKGVPVTPPDSPTNRKYR